MDELISLRLAGVVMAFAQLCLFLRVCEYVYGYGAVSPNDYILMVCDNAPWHKSQGLNIPDNIKLYPLLPYTPELNPIEMIWDELREKFFKIIFSKHYLL